VHHASGATFPIAAVAPQQSISVRPWLLPPAHAIGQTGVKNYSITCLVANARSDRLSGAFLQEKLAMYCRGQKVVKDTIHWALENDVLIAHRKGHPTSYSLTDKGGIKTGKTKT
jgi:hypothetical protein